MSGDQVHEHGKAHAYKVHRCRCGPCTEANRRQQRAYMRRLLMRGVPPHVAHGTSNAYSNYSCRCDVCRECHSQRMKARAAGRVAS